MRRPCACLLAACSAALLLAGCAGAQAPAGAGTPPSPAPSAGAPSAPAPSAAGAAVPRALDFTAPAVAGGRFSGRSLAGRAAVLWFWTPGCGVCQGEAPEVAAVAAQLRGKVAFVGIPGLAPEADMKAFVTRTGVGGFPHAVDADGRLWSGFGITSQPSFGFLRRDGRLEVEAGPLSRADLARRAAELTG